jgi:2-polyprenyl-6-methoxyphenol hydroxylase-like FAD-dependent oxidoreductase
MTKRAIVVGGSISGLFAAALLRRKGWQADVFERVDVELKGRGAGIVSHPELLDILNESGAGTSDLGIQVNDRVLFDLDGNVIKHLHFPQILTSWDRLQNLVRHVQPEGTYHLNHSLVGFEQDADGVTVRFENGRVEKGDILVAADGFRSAVRNILAPQVQPIYAGYVIWRSVVDEADLEPATHTAVFEKFTFFLEPGHEVVGYPIAGPNNDLRPGKRRYNFVWYRTINEKRLADMLTDATGKRHAISIPPPLVRADVVQEMRDKAETFMTKPMLSVLHTVKSAFFTPIYDLACPSMAFGRVALIGDAAFVGRPHVGLGVTKGAADAKALADALAQSGGDVESGLRAFDENRRPIGDLVVAKGRELGAFLDENGARGHVDGIDEHHQDKLLRETAADHFLRQYAAPGKAHHVAQD